jgi:hypothetical protein
MLQDAVRGIVPVPSEVVMVASPEVPLNAEGAAQCEGRAPRGWGVERGQRPNKGRSPVLGPRHTRLQGYSSSTKVTSRLTL